MTIGHWRGKSWNSAISLVIKWWENLYSQEEFTGHNGGGPMYLIWWKDYIYMYISPFLCKTLLPCIFMFSVLVLWRQCNAEKWLPPQKCLLKGINLSWTAGTEVPVGFASDHRVLSTALCEKNIAIWPVCPSHLLCVKSKTEAQGVNLGFINNSVNTAEVRTQEHPWAYSGQGCL